MTVDLIQCGHKKKQISHLKIMVFCPSSAIGYLGAGKVSLLTWAFRLLMELTVSHRIFTSYDASQHALTWIDVKIEDTSYVGLHRFWRISKHMLPSAYTAKTTLKLITYYVISHREILKQTECLAQSEVMNVSHTKPSCLTEKSVLKLILYLFII